jgi:hypothetical protein
MRVRAQWSLIRMFFACYMALSSANAADPEFSPQVWFNPGIYSYHFDRSQNFREDNLGLGVEVLLTMGLCSAGQ